MTPDKARAVIENVLLGIVPDADFAALPGDADIREALDLDSLDFLNFVESLSDRSGHRIDEDDYPGLSTMTGAVAFLSS